MGLESPDHGIASSYVDHWQRAGFARPPEDVDASPLKLWTLPGFPEEGAREHETLAGPVGLLYES
jgi:hypothetical protein